MIPTFSGTSSRTEEMVLLFTIGDSRSYIYHRSMVQIDKDALKI